MRRTYGAGAAGLAVLKVAALTTTLRLDALFMAAAAAGRRRHIPPAGQVFSVGMGALEIQARMLRLGQHLLVVAAGAVAATTPALVALVRSSSLYSQLNR
jgi:hypothetical protein